VLAVWMPSGCRQQQQQRSRQCICMMGV
jgi:hypothetical protein